jgi:hypothetical protein
VKGNVTGVTVTPVTSTPTVPAPGNAAVPVTNAASPAIPTK